MVNMVRPLLFYELYDVRKIDFSPYKLKELFIKSMNLFSLLFCRDARFCVSTGDPDASVSNISSGLSIKMMPCIWVGITTNAFNFTNGK
jgi:hypothetical protein